MNKIEINVDVVTGKTSKNERPFTTQELADAKAIDDAQPKAYIAKRQAEYPPMTDYLDAIVKGDTAQQQAYIDACLAVKLKYPKV